METNPDILAARAALKAKMGDTRTGGKGTARRKQKQAKKSNSSDDKRLQQTLKRLGVNTITGIEEVNMFKEDGQVIHFDQPKVQASIQANTYVISGNAETKKLQDLLPGIISQLGPDNLQNLQKIAESFKQENPENDEDDDVPDLVENFEEVSKE